MSSSPASAAPKRESAVSADDVFLSYNSADRAAVQRVRALLQARGLSPYVDSENLPLGQNWFERLEQALGQARAVAVFLGPSGLGRFQKREIALAMDRQTRGEVQGTRLPVIPILLPGVVKPEEYSGFLLTNTYVDLRNQLDDSVAIDRLEQAVSGTAAVEEPSYRPETAALCPYRALDAFREHDSPLFFGRNRLVGSPDRLEEGLLQKTRTCPLVAVIGASGSGKSSVVQAGLLPLLRREPPSRGTWDAVVFQPGKYPFLSLATAIEVARNPDATPTTHELDAAKLARSWAKGKLPLDFTLSCLRDALQVNRLLLIVDQFEQLFTQTPNADRHKFVANLLAGAGPERHFTVLLTLRADFYGRALELSRSLSDMMQRGIINVGAMDLEERREAIERPAGLLGLEFERGLVERILDDVGDEPGNLPLLEFMLTELWERRDRRRLTHTAYTALGRVAGAIGRRADSVFGNLHQDQQAAAPRLFGRLVRVSAANEQGTDTRLRARLRDLDPAARSVVEPFVKGRLLVASRDESLVEQSTLQLEPAAQPAEDPMIVEVAHEALIRTWDRLKNWINDDRKFLLWRLRLNFLITEWEYSDRNAGALLRGAPLSQALRFARDRHVDLNDREREFLAQSGKTRTARYQITKVLKDASAILNQAEPDTVGRWFGALTLTGDAHSKISKASLIKNPSSRVRALASVVRTLAQTGRLDEAKEAALKVKEAAVGIDEPYIDRMALVFAVLARAGLLNEAKNLVAGAESSNLRSAAFRSGAVVLLEAGFRDEAKEVARDAEQDALCIEFPSLRVDALASVADIFSRAGFVDDARKAARETKNAAAIITHPDNRPQSLITAAISLARAGLLAEAKNVALEAREAALGSADPNLRCNGLVTVAVGEVQAGLVDEAKQTALKAREAALSIENAFNRSESSAHVVAALAAAGLLDDARKASASILFAPNRSEAMVSVVAALADAGLHAEAEQAALGIEDARSRSDALATVADAMASAGFADRANAVARQIDQFEQRSRALASVAKARARMREFREARRLAKSCDLPNHRLDAFTIILSEYIRRKKPELAKLIGELEKPEFVSYDRSLLSAPGLSSRSARTATP
jgi:hypothetical protein